MAQPRSRIGFRHQIAAEDEATPNLDAWLTDLAELHAGWLCLSGSSQQKMPENFVRGLIKAGVQPLIHLTCPIGSRPTSELTPLLYTYASWGVRYVVVYDRPNMKDRWPPNAWSRTGLVDRFLDATLPLLQAQLAAGLTPILPPLEPGGDYWDTAFLESYLKGLARRAQRKLLQELAIALDARCHGRPFDWGAGGAQAWPQARPYSTPSDSQDHVGFRLFEWYGQIVQQTLGAGRPMLALRAGARPDEEASNETNARLAHWLREEPPAAADLIAVCFDAVPDRQDRLRWLARATTCEQKGAVRLQAIAAESEGKSLPHYLLLPADEAQAVKAWRHASAFALTQRPVVGFSAQEAAMAHKVTIAGGPDAVPLSVDDDLRQAGCLVQRLTLLPKRKSECLPKKPTSSPREAMIS